MALTIWPHTMYPWSLFLRFDKERCAIETTCCHFCVVIDDTGMKGFLFALTGERKRGR